jgi:hypothetical protein
MLVPAGRKRLAGGHKLGTFDLLGGLNIFFHDLPVGDFPEALFFNSLETLQAP